MGRFIEKYKVSRNLDVDESGDCQVSHMCMVFGILATNLRASTLYLKVYDKASAPNQNDTPTLTIPVPSSGTIQIVGGKGGIEFKNGVGLRATTGISDNDTGAPDANEMVVNILYK